METTTERTKRTTEGDEEKGEGGDEARKKTGERQGEAMIIMSFKKKHQERRGIENMCLLHVQNPKSTAFSLNRSQL